MLGKLMKYDLRSCLRKFGPLWIAAVAALVMLLTAGAMLVSWTSRDSMIIEGLQGRYFLPVLPLFLPC